MSLQFHHIGVAVERIETAADLVAALWNCRIVKGPLDDPIQQVTVCFLHSGNPRDPTIELVAPQSAEESKASPISAYLRKRIGGYHICYEVNNLEESLAKSRNLGCVVIGKPVAAVAFEGRRIAWVYTPDSLLFEMLEK